MYFAAIVNDKHNIRANTWTQLLRLASRKANNDFSIFDKMSVTLYTDDGETLKCDYYRSNRLFPNNTIIRGKWR